MASVPPAGPTGSPHSPDQAPRVRQRSVSSGGVWAAVTVGVLLVAALLAAVFLSNPSLRRVPLGLSGIAGNGARVDVATLAADPSSYLGRRVQVVGEVDLVLGPRGLLLSPPGAPGQVGSPEVLVVSARRLNQLAPAPSLLLEGSEVRVTGIVREFDFLSIERELGVDLSDALFARYVGYPVIVATGIAE